MTSPLTFDVDRALDQADTLWQPELGMGSRLALRDEYARALEHLSPADAGAWLKRAGEIRLGLESAHWARHGRAALAAELVDERERDEASVDDGALVRYQSKWERKLARFSRAHPERWRVPGLSCDEVRDALILRLIEVVRSESEGYTKYCRAGKEWGLCVVRQHLRALLQRFRLEATPVDFREVSVLERGPSQEERWLELEAEACRASARDRAQSQLSRPQRRWLAALTLAARSGEFFRRSDRLNLSAASRVLGKNRSSAQRAFDSLQECFMRELERER